MTRLATALVVCAGMALGGCYESDDFEVTAPNLESFLSLEAQNGASTLPADGVSRMVLVATISPASATGNRTIVFSTSAGTLIGGTTANGAQEVAVDSAGRAEIELQSALRVGRAQIRATVKGNDSLSRILAIDFVEIDPGEVLRFAVAPSRAPADGATGNFFTVTVSPQLDPAARMVQFRATQGTFADSGSNTTTIPADGGLTATAQLLSPSTITTALVSATVGGVTRQTSIAFERALPDRIAVSTDKFQVMGSSADKATLTAKLERNLGAVTAETPITLSMRAADGSVFGLFRNITTSNASGQATAEFVPGDTSYTGQVTITVGAEGGSVTGDTVIEIVAPQ